MKDNFLFNLIIIISMFFVVGCEMNKAFLAGVAEGIHKQQQIDSADRVVRCKKYYSGDVVCTEYNK